MFNFIKDLFKPKPKYQELGALIYNDRDTENLYKFDEIVATANKVNWNKQLNPERFNFPVRNQNGSGSCVGATRALIWSIMYFQRTGIWVDFSFKWVYGQRSNKPAEGMFAQDVLSVGMIPDDLMPSDNLSEAQMNDIKLLPWLPEIAKVFEMGVPITVPVKDIDKIASIIETTGKPLQIFVRFGPGEWGKVPKILGNNMPYGHSITVLPEYGLYESEKALLIQDSWGKDLNTINGKRIIKESFFKQRNVFAQYWMNFKFDGMNTKPKYDGSVTSLQDCLTYDGVFPSNVTARGYFGQVTVEAVKKFQAKYGILVTGSVGRVTTAKLNELFS